MKKAHLILLAAVMLAAMPMTACSDRSDASSASEKSVATEAETANPIAEGYRQISQEEAQKMMDTEKEYIIL
ncbi:MAG: hypothetical protein IJ639_00615, partial [Ruminococcus sp.]|nr:hypothetical protein [Ruminococcus sp.]